MSDFELPKNPERKATKGASLPAPSVSQVETAADQAQEENVKPTPKYDPDELLRVFDEIIFSGEYSEDVTIKGRLKVGFRTRNAEEIDEISKVVDGTSANLVSTLSEKRSILNLQYALTAYQGIQVATLKSEDRSKFIKKLPAPIIGALLTALQKFDEKVYFACQEGEENF